VAGQLLASQHATCYKEDDGCDDNDDDGDEMNKYEDLGAARTH
jgi:hypothetical protein